MTEKRIKTIQHSIEVPAPTLLLGWFLIILLPVAVSLAGFDAFISEYGVFIAPQAALKGYTTLEEMKQSAVYENYLTEKAEAIRRISLASDSKDLNALNAAISRAADHKPLISYFFSAGVQRIQTKSNIPETMPIHAPNGAILKKNIQALVERYEKNNSDDLAKYSPGYAANANILQTVFSTMAPVILRKDAVKYAYSIKFGGELYFMFCIFNTPQAGQQGCLLVFSGLDINYKRLFKKLEKKYENCKTSVKLVNVSDLSPRLKKVYSLTDPSENERRLVVPPDQRMLRSYIHRGGFTAHKINNCFAVPYFEYSLKDSGESRWLFHIRRIMRSTGLIIVLLSAIALLHMILFGIDMNIGFKRRIMLTAAVVAVFPFLFFCGAFYLNQQYEAFLSFLDLKRHVDTRLTKINNQLSLYQQGIENGLRDFQNKLKPEDLHNEDKLKEALRKFTDNYPASAVAIHRPNRDIVKMDLNDRISPENKDSLIISFENEVTKEIINVFNSTEKAPRGYKCLCTVIGGEVGNDPMKKLIYDSTFSAIPIENFRLWYTSTKMYEPGSSKLLGVFGAKFETGAMLKAFFKTLDISSNNFTEIYRNSVIKYAFFPTRFSGSKLVWNGSGNTNLPLLAKLAEKQAPESGTLSENNKTYYISGTINNEIPHIAAAQAEIPDKAADMTNITVSLVLYLALLMFFISELLDKLLVKPVIKLAQGAREIVSGRDVWQLSLRAGDEFEELNDAFKELVVGLKQRNMLKDYVSDEAVSEIETTTRQNLSPGGEYCEATIIFAEISNYAQKAEALSSEAVIEMLNVFITQADDTAKQHRGTIDKIIGSTIMLVFREHADIAESAALRASGAALQLAEKMNALQMPICAGIASGTVISGRIGSYTGKLDFTVIGNPVNTAARLKLQAHESTSGIIISGSTMRLLKGKGKVNFLRRSALKGKAREYNIYELYALR